MWPMIENADLKKILIARTLRMTGTICFIGVTVTAGPAFKDMPPHTLPWAVLPTSTLYSLGMSLTIALGAQIWLWVQSKKSRVHREL